MPNRIIREGILTSERINELTWEEEVFYRRLLSVVDDFGRFTAHPALLRAALFPLKLDTVRDSNMERLLAANEQARLVRIYEVAGKRYLEVHDFGQQVRAKSSKYPNPPSQDHQLRSTCAADAKQVLASAHLDVGGDVSVFVSEDDIPPPRERAEKFAIYSDWEPSTHLPEIIRRSGMPVLDSEQFAFSLSEFITYWMTQKSERSQGEWDNAFVKSLKADHLKSQGRATSVKVSKFDPVAHVNRNRKDAA